MKRLLATLGALFLSACSAKEQILVHVESDRPLAEVSRFSVEAIGDTGTRDEQSFARTGDVQSIGILRPDGATSLTVRVRSLGGRELVMERTVTAFVDRVVHLWICVSEVCAASEGAPCSPSFRPSAEVRAEDSFSVAPPADFVERCHPQADPPPPPPEDAGMQVEIFPDASFPDAEDLPDRTADPMDSGQQDSAFADATIMDAAVPDAGECSDWWDLNWTERRRLVIDNAALTQELLDFPLLIALEDTEIETDEIRSNAEDLRFTDEAGTLLDYEIEMFQRGGPGFVWVRVPRIRSGGNPSAIYMYYGNSNAPDAQDRAGVWSGYQGVWHMHTGPNGNAPQVRDSTVFGNHATSHNLPGNARGPGQIGDALSFDGIDDYLSVIQASSLDLTNRAFTVELWSKVSSLGTSQAMFGVHAAEDDNRSLHLRTEMNGSVRMGYWADDLDSAGPVYMAGRWHYSVFAYASLNDTSRVLVDGTQVAAGPQGPFNPMTSVELAIGRWREFDPDYFGGMIDEVRVSFGTKSDEWYGAQHRAMTRAGFVIFGEEEDCD